MRIWDIGYRALEEFKQSLAQRSRKNRRCRRAPQRGLSFEQLEPRYALAGLAGSVVSIVNSNTYALPNVLISIVGRDQQNNVIASASAKTAVDGSYSFAGLPAGTYSVTETQPTNLANGSSIVGTAGGTVGTDVISNIVLGAGVNATGYNFREKGMAIISFNLFLSSTPSTGQVLANAVSNTSSTPPAVALTSVTDPLNSSNANSATASGTGKAGATVSVVVTDGTKTSTARTATVAANGTWTVSGINVNQLANGSVQYRATITDSSGGTALSTLTATKNATGSLVNITSATNPITIGNQQSVSASGTGQPGATVSVVVANGAASTAARTATISAGGTWSITGIDVSALADGTLTFRATASDTSGNTSAPSTLTRLKDTVAVVTITSVTDPVNASNQTNTTANGTTEAGATVSVVASDGTTTTSPQAAVVAANGTWSVSGINVSALSDGAITYTATATDSLGNTGTSTRTSTKSTPSGTLAVDDSYNLAIGATLTTTTANGVLANDSSGALNPTLVSGPAHGSVTLNADGTFTYTQTTYGFDKFVYEVSNSGGQTEQATVIIQVPGLPRLPDGAVITTLPSGLHFYDFTVGTGASPSATARVTVDYVGYLPDGEIFDSSNNIDFPLNGLIVGFSEGVQGMKVGGARRIIIPPDLGYGSGGNPGAGIGGTDTIIFDVTLDAIL